MQNIKGSEYIKQGRYKHCLNIAYCKFLNNLPSKQYEKNRILVHINLAYFHLIDKLLAKQLKKQEQINQETYNKLSTDLKNSFRNQMIKKLKYYKQCNIKDIKEITFDIPKYGIIILNNQLNKINLCKWKNILTIAGGKIAEQQTPKQCAIREIKEEMGVQFSLNNCIGQIQFNYQRNEIKIFGSLQPREIPEIGKQHRQIESYKWYNISDTILKKDKNIQGCYKSHLLSRIQERLLQIIRRQRQKNSIIDPFINWKGFGSKLIDKHFK